MGTLPKVAHKRVTVIDVARAAGVSPGTVSNAISGKRKVDDETRARIEAAIRNLGYRPNLAARKMRTGGTHSIAIISSMPTAVAAGSSKLGFLMEIAASAAITALEMNAALVLIPPIDDPLATLKTLSMDGALVVEPEDNDPVLAYLEGNGIPTVCIGKPLGSASAYIALDYHAMAQMLVEHLFEVGATQLILMVGTSPRQSNLVFKQVYREKAAQIGMPEHIIEVPENSAEDSAAAAMSDVINSGIAFDAVLAPIDAMATGVMQALRQHNRRVPNDVRVATRYDGVRAKTESPPLTAIDLKLEDVADIATRHLTQIIEATAGPSTIAAPRPFLVARGTSLTD
jgi:DNA-binding LacI/PurR family transcriptional regulator